jgi:hypothetical protein
VRKSPKIKKNIIGHLCPKLEVRESELGNATRSTEEEDL